ncbi:hypothetical protein RRG08_037332 [Elysia crispata]|uniref:Uncharacterized protein n=1 Tax=Elysia crispata TaxID=231223 RepID=A0AAE1AFR5_9GAST|nr:hypothetical protein RRG08_037332 [Elysia crispata]
MRKISHLAIHRSTDALTLSFTRSYSPTQNSRYHPGHQPTSKVSLHHFPEPASTQFLQVAKGLNTVSTTMNQDQTPHKRKVLSKREKAPLTSFKASKSWLDAARGEECGSSKASQVWCMPRTNCRVVRSPDLLLNPPRYPVLVNNRFQTRGPGRVLELHQSPLVREKGGAWADHVP